MMIVNLTLISNIHDEYVPEDRHFSSRNIVYDTTTAGLDVQYEPTKTYFPTNQKGYDKSETTDEKLSARRIQIFQVYFSVILF